MLVTNETSQDYWFGPLHLPAGVGQTLTVDDTSETSLYLTSDAVADAINNLYASGKITVTSAASPFPRPTGVPQLLHGDGTPEGLVYAPQGSLYMRRDSTNASSSVYSKTTGTTISTGWQALSAGVSWTKLSDTGAIASAQASFDFASIDQSHDHLKLMLKLRSDAASGILAATLKLNADATNSYYAQNLGGAGNTASAAGGATVGGPPDLTGVHGIPTAGAFNAADYAYVEVDFRSTGRLTSRTSSPAAGALRTARTPSWSSTPSCGSRPQRSPRSR